MPRGPTEDLTRISHIQAWELASKLLKQAGFIINNVSLCSETCYYYHSAKYPNLLRLSHHKNKSKIGMNAVLSKITISERDMHCTELNITNKVIYAIGKYFVEIPKPSQYKGKRGTW